MEMMANNEAGLITSIIDTKSKAIFRDVEISGFAERFDSFPGREAPARESCGRVWD
jgi:hypothetical protein